MSPLVCSSCNGSGRDGRRDCDTCHGHGHLACTLCSHHEPATRMAGDEPTCEACGALVDADIAAWQASEIERDALDRSAEMWADIAAQSAREAVR